MNSPTLLIEAPLHTSFRVKSVMALIVVALVSLQAHAAQPSVVVSSVAELYEEVNSPTNVGVQVVLAPGVVYLLDPSFPNGGRLELQEDMALIGQVGDPGAVVIDASLLTGTTTGPVRMGRGSNTIEWLTVQNDRAGTGVIETDLAPTLAPTRIRVAHVIVQGGQRGIDFRMLGSAYNDRVVEGVFEDNVIRNNTRGMSTGMRITISNVAQGTVRATLHGNVFEGNQAGILAANQTTTDNTIEIDSSADRFTNNRAGTWLIGGIGATSSFNLLKFTAHGDVFDDNGKPQTQPPYTTGGGVVALGAANHASNNVAHVEIFDSQFSSNGPYPDVSVFGYYDPLVGPPPGINNRLELRLSPVTQATTLSVPSDPQDLSHTNSVVMLPPLLTALSPAQVWIGLKNSDDVGTKFDLLAEVFRNDTLIGSGQLNDVPGGSSGFNNARLDSINLVLPDAVEIAAGDTVSIRLSVRVAATSGHRSGTARLWFNDATANSRFGGVVGSVDNAFFLRSGSALATSAGPGPRETKDVLVDRAAGGNPFKPFGVWVLTCGASTGGCTW